MGSLAGGVSAVTNAVKKSQTAQKNLEETRRHNKIMEELAKATGKGLFLRPYLKNGGGVKKKKLTSSKRYRKNR